MKKIILSLSLVAVVAAVASVATYAYFNDSDKSEQNKFATGTLSVSVEQSSNEHETSFTNMEPGGTQEVRFDVDNDGSLPVYLKGYAAGTWNNSALDDTYMKVVKVEYYDGGWKQLVSKPSGLTGEYYYGIPGTYENKMYELASGATEQFRLTVKFDENADNTYQNKTFKARINIAAKQVTAPAGAGWPSTY